MASEFNFIKNKAYIFGNKPQTFQSEIKIIQDICRQNDLNGCKNIRHIDSHINYDLFFAEINDGPIAIKLSLDLKHPLKKEFSILKKNIESHISPYPLACGVHNNVSYSILGRFQFENLNENGRAEICNSHDAVPIFIAKLSSFDYEDGDLDTFDTYIDKLLNFDIYQVPEVEISWIENHKKVKSLIRDQVSFLQSKIKDKLNTLTLSETHFCHGNLTASNILAHQNFLLAINFEDAYFGDAILEFALIKYETFYEAHQDRILYSKFCELMNRDYNVDEYFEYQELAAYISILKTLINYLTEVYVLKCNRENLVTQDIIKFIKNYNSFTVLPDFQQKLKPIADFFLESVK